MTYCDRNGQQCEMAGELWGAFLRKAEFAGKLAYDVALRAAAQSEDGARIEPAKARGTLQPSDLQPNWRGSPDQGGA